MDEINPVLPTTLLHFTIYCCIVSVRSESEGSRALPLQGPPGRPPIPPTALWWDGLQSSLIVISVFPLASRQTEWADGSVMRATVQRELVVTSKYIALVIHVWLKAQFLHMSVIEF